ncbi:MAG: polymer-forming cytoskeletal protein [Caulobacteraceae bacterium]|nr:polymer-forming cytoskeletal protein [Caulobacteraceae bacterium]
MFSKSPPPSPASSPSEHPTDGEGRRAPLGQGCRIGADMVLEGAISGGGEIHIDGVVKGEVRVERVFVGEGGKVDGGIYADVVEIRGKVSGLITAKQVRLQGACDVDADIHHEQLAMEPGASFQGRSLRLQRDAPPAGPRA